jgi:hypothetical protein
METINQPSRQPTNKVAAVTAATAAWAIIVSIGSLLVQNLAPTWYWADAVAALSECKRRPVGDRTSFVAGRFFGR